MESLWQWAALLAGIGFFALSLVACLTLLNLARSLRTVEAILALTLDEARRALPEVRHSLEQIDDMVTSVNEKFSAADRAMNATGATLTGWRDRVREGFQAAMFWARPGSRTRKDSKLQ